MSLEDNPFDYRITKDGHIMVSRGGKQIVILAGPDADRIVSLLGKDDAEDQELLARATGNYRRGNERRGGKNGPRR